MNADYMVENGFAIFDGLKYSGVTISIWCKDRGMVYGKDYKWHSRRVNAGEKVRTEIIFQFKDPKQATLAMIQWS